MLIKKLKIKNIRSYKSAEIVFPEGSTLLMGDIGSGKTSVLLAIEFALFGLQPGQKGGSLLRNNEDEGYVTLEFEIDGINVIIERALKRSGKSITQSDISITINNERTEGSVTEIKNKILSLLGYPPEFIKKTNDLYKFTVYTPQEEMKQIILEPSDVRLNTLRHVFGIDKYKRIEENLDILTSRIRQEIRTKEIEVGNLEEKKLSIKEKRELVEKQQVKLSEIEKELKTIESLKQQKQSELEGVLKKINEKNKLEAELGKSEMALTNKKEMISTIEREIAVLNEQLKVLSTIKFEERALESVKLKLKTKEQILKELNEQYISFLTTIQSEEAKIKELDHLREKISALEKCPTCLQVVNADYKKNIIAKAEEELKIIGKKILEIKKNKEEINKEIEQTKNEIDSLRHSLSELEILKVKLESLKEKEKRISELEKQKATLSKDIAMIKDYIENISSKIKELDAYSSVYEQRNREMNEIINKENSIRIRKAEANKEIQFLETQIKTLEEEIRKIEETAKMLNYMKELEFWLNNKFIELVLYTEKNVMLKLREEFSELFSDWFSILVPEGISARLDESFSPILERGDYELDYSYLSGGERTAVALAYRLALNQVINSLLSRIKTRDLVILDEPTDGFSESQLDKIRDVLNQLKVRQLILVSHEPKIEGFVENIIRFQKVDDITKVEN